MSKVRALKNANKYMYDVASVPAGFDYWYYKLLNYCLGIYQYDGLPESLPGREILMNLILTGHAVIFEDKGELVTTRTTIYDYDKYYRPTKATFGNVKIFSKKLTFGVDSEIIYLTRIQGNVLNQQAVDSGLSTFIKRYARMLADMESSINIYSVNTRTTFIPVGATDQVRQSIMAFYNAVAMGEKAVVTDDLIIEAFRNVALAPNVSGDKINDLLIARDKILATFFRDIGIKFEQEQKKAQLTEDEVTADEQLLLLNVNDMLDVQREGLERVNRHFGTSITVKLNPTYNRTTYNRKERVTDGNTEDSNPAE